MCEVYPATIRDTLPFALVHNENSWFVLLGSFVTITKQTKKYIYKLRMQREKRKVQSKKKKSSATNVFAAWFIVNRMHYTYNSCGSSLLYMPANSLHCSIIVFVIHLQFVASYLNIALVVAFCVALVKMWSLFAIIIYNFCPFTILWIAIDFVSLWVLLWVRCICR